METSKLKELRITINSFFGGQSPVVHGAPDNQFLSSISIDPEAKGTEVSSGLLNTIGAAYPNSPRRFSTPSDAPLWITGTNTSTGAFVYGAGGTLYAYTNGSFTLDGDGGIVQPSGGAGNGIAVSHDYLYLSTGTNISRFGPLSTTAPRLWENFWTGSGGFGQAALTNSSSPVVRGVTYPNHVMHAHNDGYVYVADYYGNQGAIHSFYITNADSGTIATFGDLALPPGYIPLDIKSYDTDLAILCSAATDFTGSSNVVPGRSALFLWDTISNSFYRNVPINHHLATALVNKNGELFVIAGSVDREVSILKYLGGESFQTLVQIKEGSPPPAGAATSVGNRLFWGGYGTIPSTFAGLYALGYKNGSLPSTALNQVVNISGTGTLPIVTAVSNISRSSQLPGVGWHTTSPDDNGLDLVSSGQTYSAILQTKMFDIGTKFNIRRIRIPMSEPISSATTITPTIYIDDYAVSHALATINNTNYPNSERIIDYTDLAVGGYNNFFISFAWTGTGDNALLPGITIDLDLYD